MDTLTKKARSSLMAKVRVKDTDIEIILGKLVRPLWKIERYRKNVSTLPGKPDIVFPRSRIAIFADGDFWHGKDFKKWKLRMPLFWRKKIGGNIERDRLQNKALRRAGYQVLRFYGSKIKHDKGGIVRTVRSLLQ